MSSADLLYLGSTAHQAKTATDAVHTLPFLPLPLPPWTAATVAARRRRQALSAIATGVLMLAAAGSAAARQGELAADPDLPQPQILPASEFPLDTELLQDDRLILAALRAGGASPTEAAREQAHWMRHVTRCRHELEQESLTSARSLGTTSQRRAAAALAYLHRHVLTGPFDAQCYQVSQTLRRGRYNCLTSTLLYWDLCRRLQLPAQVIGAPGHVLIALQTQPPCLVETTCRCWSDACRLPTSSSPCESLTSRQLMSRIYYNRGIALADQGRWADALRATQCSWQLDPQYDAARHNAIAIINNWAASLYLQQDLPQARALVRWGLQLAPGSEPLLMNAARLQGP